MAQFISFRGMWFPAVEEVSLVYNGEKDIPKSKISKYVTFSGDFLKKGMPFIYKGPDRAAMEMLKKEDLEYLGQDFEHDPEFLEKVRKFNFNTVKEYLAFIGYDEAKDKERFEKLAVQVSRNELPEPGEEAFILGGGQDKAEPKNDIVGGFGDPEIKKKK